MLVIVCFMILVFFAETSLQRWWIGVMHNNKIQQMTKLYGPAWHSKTKFGTPSMGGVVFIIVFLLCVPLFMQFYSDRLYIPTSTEAFMAEYGDFLSVTAAILSYPILAAFVGLIDDTLKFRRQSSDGLTSIQKLFLQILVTAPWAYWMHLRTVGEWNYIMNFQFVFIPAVTFIGVGLQNAVNVTDGLDGLATGCSLITFVALLPLTVLSGGQITGLFNAAAIAVCLGFLWHNCNPASVFMGDVGAHFLAGLMLSLCVCSGSIFYIIPACFFFGVEILADVAQIIAIRRYKRKIFKMCPIHHHFELSGWKETQIVTRFCLVHLFGVSLLCTAYIVFVD